jgi:hypothetical protein
MHYSSTTNFQSFARVPAKNVKKVPKTVAFLLENSLFLPKNGVFLQKNGVFLRKNTRFFPAHFA